ncbi:hypothetical protein ACH5RR_035279 [Cinchona calisaya]|uniref:LYR motif-containing protein 2 n=1 Tax=Cinchona calisaya TaxID=153742 RepID=A0ABD2YDD4_9GENT
MAAALTLDLRDFLLRARVLKLYRQALRTIRRAPVDARVRLGVLLSVVSPVIVHFLLAAAELRDIIRQEIEINRNCNDKQKIRFLISDGLQRLKGLDETLDMQGRG